ncbi:MAG: hypothetical protein R2867_10630 [Caldilineaceae bacterium]
MVGAASDSMIGFLGAISFCRHGKPAAFQKPTPHMAADLAPPRLPLKVRNLSIITAAPGRTLRASEKHLRNILDTEAPLSA